MEVQLTPDQKAFVRQAFESRRLQREEVAVTEALPWGNGASGGDWKYLVAAGSSGTISWTQGGTQSNDAGEAKQLAADERAGAPESRAEPPLMSEFRLSSEADGRA